MLTLVQPSNQTFSYSSEDDVILGAMNILESRMQYGEFFKSPVAIANYFQLRIGSEEREVFTVMYLSASLQCIYVEDHFKGTICGAAVYPREIVKTALRVNAAYVFLAHNHPGQTTDPSQADKTITRKIGAALELVDIQIRDHIIVSCRGYFSFAQDRLALN